MISTYIDACHLVYVTSVDQVMSTELPECNLHRTPMRRGETGVFI